MCGMASGAGSGAAATVNAAATASAAAASALTVECVVCLDAPVRSRLRPCCHMVMCAPCARGVVARERRCPACRAVVERSEEGVFEEPDEQPLGL